MALDVNPTRMELIKTKDRIKLAQKGHKLLKQKRDALILEFFKILKKSQDMRALLAQRMAAAYSAIGRAESYHTSYELDSVSLAIAKDISVELDVKNVMGVKIPYIQSQVDMKKYSELPTYSFAGTSAKIDAAVEQFDEVLAMAIKLAETETAIKRLITEIEKTKRRVNALEFVLMPRLEETKKSISFRLDEMERDYFVSLKTIKRKLEKEQN